MAALEDEAAELRVVVGLAVVDDDDRAVLVAHRLRSALHVLDRESAVPQAHTFADEEAVTVRPAVRDGVRHRANQVRVTESGRACDPAHQPLIPKSRRARRKPRIRPVSLPA